MPARLDYHAEDRPPQDRPPLAAAPTYGDVLRGARWLHGIAVLAQVFACLLIVLGVGAVAMGFLDDQWQRRVARGAEQVPDMVWLVGGCVMLAAALLLLFCASMIGMMSGLAVAVRDIARNSFHRTGEAPRDDLNLAQLRQHRALPVARRIPHDDAPPAGLLPGG